MQSDRNEKEDVSRSREDIIPTTTEDSNDGIYEPDQPKRKIIPNAAFPFCGYNGNFNEGVYVEEYDEHYCSGFQVKMILNIFLDQGV